jgi:hypothetical protein
MVLFISKKRQKRGRWFGRRVLFDSPTRLGLVRLAGTVSAPRPNRWRLRTSVSRMRENLMSGSIGAGEADTHAGAAGPGPVC